MYKNQNLLNKIYITDTNLRTKEQTAFYPILLMGNLFSDFCSPFLTPLVYFSEKHL